MALNDDGITALLNDGNEAVIWIGIGDGPTSADQTSDQRRQLVSSVANSVITATGVPYAYTGPAAAGATHALLFSASTAGTFYGSGALTGDQTFNADGVYNLNSFSISGAASTGTPEGSGERAAPNTVGYLGATEDLIDIVQDQDLTGTPFVGADWFPGVLVVPSDLDLTIEGYHLHTALFFSGDGNHTIRNCIIEGGLGQSFGLGSAATTAEILVEDTTVIYAGEGSAVGLTQFAVIRRCDISGGENSIVFYSQPAADFDAAPTVSQCWLHDQLYDQVPDDHVDAIEVHQDGALATKLVIEHCYIEGSNGPGGEAISAAITMGQSSAAGDLTPKINNNYIGAGGYHLRIEQHVTGAVVTDNNFGVVDTDAGEFGFATVTTSGSVVTWTNNRDGSGAAGTGNVVDNPNP